MAAPELLIELKEVSFSSTTTTDDDDDSHYSMLAAIGSSGRTIDRFSPHLRDTRRVIKSPNPEKLPQQQPPLSMIKKANIEKLPLLSSSSAHQLISPATSSRYLLSESSSEDFFVDLRSEKNVVSESSFVWPEIELELPSSVQSVKVEHFLSEHPWPSSSFTMPQNQQVVVLKVSLHCKGCEGKVRKHISKMEGVTSFTTDLENKKVTVVGDVTPLGVLNSISKVKNAQLWRSLPPI